MAAAPPSTTEPAATGRMTIVGPRTITVVVALFVLELLLKHVWGYGWWTVNERDATYGWRMLPDQDARSRDLSVVEHINRWGFRDRDWAPPVPAGDGWVKDEGLLRVAVLGNSMTFGTSVPIEQVYSRVLEDLLDAELRRRGSQREALVMNFAVQGYCLEQSARVYEDFARPYRPDVLVVPLHPMDVQPMKPSTADADYDFRRLVMRSATYDMLLRNVIDRWMPPLPRSKEARAELKKWSDIEDSLRQRPFAQDNRHWFDAAGERLDVVRREVETDGGRLCLVSLPRWRKHFDAKVRNADAYFASWAWERRPDVGMVNPWPEFERLMKPVVEEIRAKGLPGGETFDLSTVEWTDAQGGKHPGDELESADQSLHLLDDMGHYTARGHAVIAQSIFETLVALGVLD